MTRIAFLDRDGVLNRCGAPEDGVPTPARSLDELELLPRVPEACALLRRLGYRLVVVTNQPDVARGTLQRSVVEAINRRLVDRLELDEVLVCWHDDADACDCRKPKPGLLIDALRDADADAGACVMIGDRWRDVEAGSRAGCRTVLVGGGYGEPFPAQPDIRVETLWDAALALRAEDEEGANR